MPKVTINAIKVEVDAGATLLDAARMAGVDIPTLCHLRGTEPETSCMLCVVKEVETGRLLPSCSAKAIEGMRIDTECGEVQAARRDILNLLLSEHVGDCEAPCTRICPAHLDIPRMLRELANGNPPAAAWIAKRDLALPATLGHVCPAPCEKGCRRGQIDSAITIRALHRTAEFAFLEGLPETGPRKVAVVGAGPAGLACAWQLRLLGHGCTVFDEAPQAGGVLRNDPSLPMETLDAEIEWLRAAGIGFHLGDPISMHAIADGFAGVVFAAAEFPGAHFADAFYAEEHKLAVKAVANGKAAATALDRFLKGAPPAKERFDSRIGRLNESELREVCKNCPERPESGNAAAEAARCLHCDCRKPESCRLRLYAQRFGANQSEYPAEERAHVRIVGHNEAVVFEPGKCIKCGICVKITKRAGEELGLAFIGRGFNVCVAVPFDEPLQASLRRAARECVDACPTGALAFREVEER